MPQRPRFIQIAFSAQIASARESWPEDARALHNETAVHAERLGLSGAAMLVNGQLVGVIEGPRVPAEGLYMMLRGSARLRGLDVVAKIKCDERAFAAWSFGLAARVESSSETAGRVAMLTRIVGSDRALRPADFFRYAASPCVDGALAAPDRRHSGSRQVAIGGPNGLWSSAMLPHIAGKAGVRVGRVQVSDAQSPESRTLIEHVDVVSRRHGPVRVLCASLPPARCVSAALLVDRLALLVVMAAPSDAGALQGYIESWLAVAAGGKEVPRVLVVASSVSESLAQALEATRAKYELDLTVASAKLSDAEAVWQQVQAALDADGQAPETEAAPEQSPATDWMPSVEPLPAAPAAHAKNGAGAALPLMSLAVSDVKPGAAKAATASKAPGSTAAAAKPAATTVAQPAAKSAGAPAVAPAVMQALADATCLERLLAVEGCRNALVLRADPPEVLLSSRGEGEAVQEDQDDAAWLHQAARVAAQLAPGDAVEDILLYTSSRLQAFRPLAGTSGVYLSLSVDRSHAQSALAKIMLAEVVDAVDRALNDASAG
jgi:hypothetical protein